MRRRSLPLLTLAVVAVVAVAGSLWAGEELLAQSGPHPAMAPAAQLKVPGGGGAFAKGSRAAWPGPDGFPYGGSSCAYSWVEISTTGTNLAAVEDDGTCVEMRQLAVAVLDYDSSEVVEDFCPVAGGGEYDGVVDPGEAVYLDVTLYNSGDADAIGVSAVLSTSTPGVSVPDSYADYPDIPQGDTGTSLISYGFEVDTGVPCGTVITFELLITAGADSWTRTFTVPVLNSSTLLLSESFDTPTPPALPAGWDTVDVAGNEGEWATSDDTVNPPGGGTYTPPNLAYFNSFTASPGSSTRLFRTAGLDLSGWAGTPVGVSFWMYHDTEYSNTDTVQVQLSTDAGASWESVGDPVYRFDGSDGWSFHRVDASAYAGLADVRLGLLATGAYGNDCHVDDVEVNALVCNDCNSIQLTPESVTAAGCPDVEQFHDLTLENSSGVASFFDVSYTVTLGSGTCTGPASLGFVPDGGTEVFQVQVTPTLPWYDVTECRVHVVHQLDPVFEDTSTVVETSAPWTPDPSTVWVDMAVGGEPVSYWGASYYYDGNVCVLGGIDGDLTVLAAHACYDIASPGWTPRAPIPTPVFSAAYGMIGGLFYLAGGYATSNFTATDALQVYDPASDTWSTGPVLPDPRGGQGGGVVGGVLYSVGGGPTASFPADCPTYAYNPAVGSWATLTSCPLSPEGWGFMLGGSVGSDYWGGLFVGGHFAEIYDLYFYSAGGDWWYLLDTLHNHRSPLLTLDEGTGTLFEVGGWSFGGWNPQSSVWAYDPATNLWSDWPDDLITATGGSAGPPHGSAGDPTLDAFWTEGGEVYNPAPLEAWQATWFYCLADLAITKDDGLTQVVPGHVVTYEIVVTNYGPADVLGATVTDLFPSALTDVSWTCGGSDGGFCTGAGVGDIDDTVGFPAGGSVTYTVTATLDPLAVGTLENTATVTGPVDITELDPENNSATDVDDIVVPEGDISVGKTDGVCYLLAGDSVTYTITVTNAAGPGQVRATVQDTFPTALTEVTWTCVGDNGGICSESGLGDVDDPVIMPAGSTVTYTVDATVDLGATGWVRNTVQVPVDVGYTDPDLGNNTALDLDALEMPIFCDGFESGTTNAWSTVQP